MKRLLLPLIGLLLLPSVVTSGHLGTKKELIITTESTKQSIDLAKHLTEQGVVKYSAYWCPNCLYQSELFGKQAYEEAVVQRRYALRSTLQLENTLVYLELSLLD